MKPKDDLWKIWVVGIVTCFLLVVLLYYGVYFFVDVHETTHQTIYSYHNVSSRVEINYFTLHGVTYANREDYNTKCDSLCRHAQDMTEVVGYHIGALIMNLWLIFVAYLVWHASEEWVDSFLLRRNTKFLNKRKLKRR
jgi:hypothetical protein